MIYIIDPEHKCSIAYQSHIELGLCLPDTSKVIGSMMFGTGASQQGLTVQVYSLEEKESPNFNIALMTPNDCTPVGFWTFLKSMNCILYAIFGF